MTVVGRFAPSPTGPLHVGNLRTALMAWLAAHSCDGTMLVRIEDLDRSNSSEHNEMLQLRDLKAMGLSHAPVEIRQSERFEIYASCIDDLRARGLVYPCYCSRREIREAVSAPNGPWNHTAYPGTCRDLSSKQRADKERDGRPPAWRLRTDAETYTFNDLVLGEVSVAVDDFVLRRNDGVPAYNLAVVVDDEKQGVTQIVRGDDLASSTGRHIHLQRLLGWRTPTYAHVPLVCGADGDRLAKRHGAVTLDDLASIGVSVRDVLLELASSIGCDTTALAHAGSDLEPRDLLESFSFERLPRGVWTIPGAWQTVDR